MADRLLEAQNLYETGEYQSAARLFEEITHDEPSNALAYQGMAQCYNELKQWDATLNASLKAIYLDPSLYQPHRLAGVAYYECQQYDRSEEELRRALNIAPTESSPHITLGAILYAQNRLEESEKLFMHVTEIQPDNWKGHCNLGFVYARTNRFGKAWNEMNLAHSLGCPISFIKLIALISNIYLLQKRGFRIFFICVYVGLSLLSLFSPIIYSLPSYIVFMCLFVFVAINELKAKQLTKAKNDIIFMILFTALVIIHWV